MRHVENLPARHTRKKVTFCWFWPEKTPPNYLTWRQNFQKVRNDAHWSKFCLKYARYAIFLMFFNQANFKYTPKKDGHMANFCRGVRSLLDFSLAAKYTKYPSKVRIWSKNARNYTKMTYRPELWRRTCNSSSTVFGFQFLVPNSSFHNQADNLTGQ